MATTLVNNDIKLITEKLMIYNRNFFDKISSELLSETTSLNDVVKLDIPKSKGDATHSTDQFGKFIKKVINFNIKNHTNLAETESDLCFVNRTAEGNYAYQNNTADNLISSLKVVNVFVDILEAYKNCIDNKEKGAAANAFDSGYTNEIKINRIELVSEKTRFYGDSNVAFPSANERNAGFIRPVKLVTDTVNKNVLFLSIQSFNTTMGYANYNYDTLFSKSGSAGTANTNFLKGSARTTPTELSETANMSNYQYQRYNDDDDDVIKTKNLTLEQRDQTLILLLLKILFGLELDSAFRKQSVYALYYYYKFVQLYTSLIIHVSNVMYHDVKINGGTSAYRIATFNTTTNLKTHGVSAIEYTVSGSTEVKDKATITTVGSFTTIGSITPTTPAALSTANVITRGKGYLQSPGVTATGATLKATIVPMVYREETLSNNDNIKRLFNVITEINDTITFLIDELSTYSLLDNKLIISTPSAENTASQTRVYPSSDTIKYVIIRVNKRSIVNSLNIFKEKYDIEKECIIYDLKNKYSYDIIGINNSTDGIFEITIKAVFVDSDKPLDDQSVKIFNKYEDVPYDSKPADLINAGLIATATDFLELRMKDTNSYKVTYTSTKNEIYSLEETIAYLTSSVSHQNNIYVNHNSKKTFLERQVLAYNIILAIILLIIVVINVVKVDKQLVKTISLSCLGIIILLYVIYFISNMTYVETYAVEKFEVGTTNPLYSLGYNGYISTTQPYGSSSNLSTYTAKKIKNLNGEINKLNSRFINYFEKLIITLPASENFDFYKEISELVINDKENKDYTKRSLGYSKNQNANNINSVKYELENNKLYLNTILISAIIFVGLYNMYINYFTDDKYLSLMIFIYIIIFIIILSYYYITANRRVKTVFKNIYWGPEFSKSF